MWQIAYACILFYFPFHVKLDCADLVNTTMKCTDTEVILDEAFKLYIPHHRPRPIHPSISNTSLKNADHVDTVIVELNFLFFSFSAVNIVDMDYVVDVLIRQRWYDPRLNVSDKITFKAYPIQNHLDKIWIPDLFFRNAKAGKLHKITKPNQLAWLDSNGVITYSQKVSIKLFCPMELWDFPMDVQFCHANMGSYGYTKKDLDFRWWNSEEYNPYSQQVNTSPLNDAVRFRRGLTLNEFNLKQHVCSYCNASFSTTGNFSCLDLKFKLVRKFGFYLLYAYLPSTLVVIISWLSFLIDYEATAARISLGLLSVLSLITQSAAMLAQLPRVSYIKALDVWFFVCFAFIASALVEFAFVNTTARREAKVVARKKAMQFVVSKLNSQDTENSQTNEVYEAIKNKSQPLGQSKARKKMSVSLTDHANIPCLTARNLDILFIIIYPTLFVLFNIVYWFIYLYTYKQKADY